AAGHRPPGSWPPPRPDRPPGPSGERPRYRPPERRGLGRPPWWGRRSALPAGTGPARTGWRTGGRHTAPAPRISPSPWPGWPAPVLCSKWADGAHSCRQPPRRTGPCAAGTG
ncbi:Helix-turn-helix type 11 domain-containing protein, partial [Dysosmobacter welbionis]